MPSIFRTRNMLRALLCASLFTLSQASRADSDPPLIVITPSKVAQPVDEVGSTVYKLDIPDLIDRGIYFVEDALREIPSVIASGYGARGSQLSIRLRGNEANHVLVLIDGVRVANAATGEYDLSNLSLFGIQSIEILEGPQSTLYGSDAIAGVINITTVKGAEGMHGSILGQAAKRGEYTAAALIQGGKNAVRYAVSVEDFKTDGISSAAEVNGNSEPDAFDRQGVRIRAGYETEAFSLDLSAGKTDSGFDFDGSDPVTGLPRDELLNHQEVSIDETSLSLTVPGRLKHRLQLSHAGYDYHSQSMLFGSLSPYDADTTRNSLGYDLNFRLDVRNLLQFGIERVDEELETASNFSSFDGDASLKGAYFNWLYSNEALNLSLGGRGNDHDAFGQYSTWRLTASYALNDDWRLRGAAGTGFKTPSLQELYDNTFGANPDLQPEESDSLELGLEYHRDRYRMSLVLFDQNTDNLIRSTGTWPNARNENVGKARSKGAELAVKSAWENLLLDFSVSKVDAEETNQGVTKKRLRIPEWSADARITYQHDKGQLWLEAQYRDERNDYNWTTSSDVVLESYTLWNLGSTIHSGQNLTLSARVDNLRNEVYEEVYGYGVPDRTIRLSARWTF